MRKQLRKITNTKTQDSPTDHLQNSPTDHLQESPTDHLYDSPTLTTSKRKSRDQKESFHDTSRTIC